MSSVRAPVQIAPAPVDMIDSRAAAALLRVHLTTVQQLAQRGEIPCCKVGKDYRFLRDALLEWLRGNDRPTRRRR